MRSVALFCCYLCLVQPLVVSSRAGAHDVATQPSTVEDQVEIDSLLKALSAENFRERGAAEDRLVRLGDPVVSRLRRFLKDSQDTEARSRAESILRRIVEEKLRGATIVSIHAHAAPPADVFAELGKNAAVTFWPNSDEVWSPKLPTVSVDLDHVDFWEAVRRIGGQCGIEPATSRRISPLNDPNGTASTIMTAPATVSLHCWANKPLPSFSHGPFFFLASSNLIRGPKEAKAQHLEPESAVWLHLICEPKLSPVIWQALDIDQAIDGDHQPLKLIDAEFAPSAVWEKIGTIEYRFATSAKKVGRFRGNTRIILATVVARLENDHLLHGVPTVWRAGDVRFEIAAVDTKKKGTWTVSATTTVEPGAAGWQADYALFTAVLNGVRCKLLDEQGQALCFTGGAILRIKPQGGADEYSIDSNFTREQEIPGVGPIPGPPVKVIWEFPAEITTVKVPFDFSDLNLWDR